MEYIPRKLESQLAHATGRGKSVLLLGPRQTGKTTLVRRLKADLEVSLLDPDLRRRYESQPGLFAGEVRALPRKQKTKPLVVLDEIQRVPVLMDIVQQLIDDRVARFILTGSSARKLRRGSSVNLLPGRVVALRQDPFSLDETAALNRTLENLLLDGSLPPIVEVESERDRETDLRSYVSAYLEEEVRAEALVRNLGPFSRFLELAAAEAGQQINANKLSQEIGVAQNTIASYYQILEDCLIIERIPALIKSHGPKRLAKTDKFLFFDLGARRIAAGEGRRMPAERMGALLEQMVGLELLRAARQCDIPCQIRYWRDNNGPEVDWVIDRDGRYTPVEVKWTDTPRDKDIRHLNRFLSDYPESDEGLLVCRVPRRTQLDDRVLALPWQECADPLRA